MASFRDRLKARRAAGTESPSAAAVSGRGDSAPNPRLDPNLAREGSDGGEDIVVAGPGVDSRGVEILVSGDALGEPDVPGGPVDVGQGGVPQLVEREASVEASAVLPVAEGAADLSGAESATKPADEQGGVDVEPLAVASLPGHEPLHLEDEAVREEDGLGGGATATPFEDAQLDASTDAPGAVEEIADVQGDDLHLTQPGAEGEGEQDVVAESADMLACDAEKPGLLGDGHGGGGTSNPVDVAHDLPPGSTFALEGDGSQREIWQLKESPLVTTPAGVTRTPLVVVKRDENDFADWLSTETGFLLGLAQFGDEDLSLEPYQIAFMRCKSDYRCVEKSRQVGYSLLFACEAIARTHLRETHNSIFVSYNLADSKEKIAYAAQLHEELPLEYQKKKVVDSKTELGFRSNSSNKRVSRIISNPSRAPRGKKGDIYLDELAHYANDREVYKGSTALILRAKGQLTVCSSPLGRRGQFWEIARQEISKFGSYWRQAVPWWLCSFFCTNVPLAAIEAPKLSTKERVQKFGKKGILSQFESLSMEDFQQEFEVLYVDESMSFFPYELILGCTNDEHETVDDFTKVPTVNRLVAGFDVGRKKDFSELSIFEQLDDGRHVSRLFMRFDKVPFRVQKNTLQRMMNLLPVARLSIDQNGLGMQMAEDLAEDYPQVEPCVLSGPSKELWLTDFKILLQQQKLVLPRNRELISQIHSIRKRITPAGRPIFETNDTSSGEGHADRLWSCVLACKKERMAPAQAAQVEVRILG